MGSPSARSHPFDALIRRALLSFGEGLRNSGWRGKENDCVNRFAHGHLLPLLGEGPLQHPTQVAVEVGVPQPPGIGEKGAARKDLVIWPRPWMSTWSADWQPAHVPTVVMEWKSCHAAKPLKGCAHDRRWIGAFARWQPTAIGFTVVVDLDARKYRLLVGRYCGAEADEEWLRT